MHGETVKIRSYHFFFKGGLVKVKNTVTTSECNFMDRLSEIVLFLKAPFRGSL